MNREQFFELYGNGLSDDAPMPFVREPLELDGMMYSLQVQYFVRGYENQIKVNISRRHMDDGWKVSVRASGINSSNPRRIADYAAALADASQFASTIDLVAVQAAHDATVEQHNRETAAQQVINDSLLAGDPELGMDKAKSAIKAAIERIKDQEDATKKVVIECARREGGWWNREKLVYILDFYGDNNWNRKVRFRELHLGRYKGVPALWDNSDVVSRKDVTENFSEGSKARCTMHLFKCGEELEQWYEKQKEKAAA